MSIATLDEAALATDVDVSLLLGDVEHELVHELLVADVGLDVLDVRAERLRVRDSSLEVGAGNVREVEAVDGRAGLGEGESHLESDSSVSCATVS